MDIGVQRVNITWSQIPQELNTTEQLTLSVSNDKESLIEVLPLSTTYYDFASSEGNTSCTAFTFMITTTLLNSIYNGSCISESNPIQQSLPSLPNITTLESSVEYSLSKVIYSFVLSVSFPVSKLMTC